MKEQIITLLEKQGKEVKGLHHTTVQKWKEGKHQMNVEKVERALKANDLPEPFFWDGTFEEFFKFAVKCANTLGKDLNLNIVIK